MMIEDMERKCLAMAIGIGIGLWFLERVLLLLLLLLSLFVTEKILFHYAFTTSIVSRSL